MRLESNLHFVDYASVVGEDEMGGLIVDDNLCAELIRILQQFGIEPQIDLPQTVKPTRKRFALAVQAQVFRAALSKMPNRQQAIIRRLRRRLQMFVPGLSKIEAYELLMRIGVMLNADQDAQQALDIVHSDEIEQDLPETYDQYLFKSRNSSLEDVFDDFCARSTDWQTREEIKSRRR